jgi:hypothetical protein
MLNSGEVSYYAIWIMTMIISPFGQIGLWASSQGCGGYVVNILHNKRDTFTTRLSFYKRLTLTHCFTLCAHQVSNKGPERLFADVKMEKFELDGDNLWLIAPHVAGVATRA